MEDVKSTPEETKENEAPQIQVQSADDEAADHSGHVDLLAETPVSLETADASENVLLTDSSTTPTECREAATEAAVPEEEAIDKVLGVGVGEIHSPEQGDFFSCS